MTLVEQWMEGFTLDEAWFHLATPQSQEEYRESGKNHHRMLALQELMRRDLLIRIRYEGLRCVGMRTRPRPSQGPALIRGFMFLDPKIDWDRSTVAAFKYAYEGVRVLRPEASIDTKEAPTTSHRKLGRPSVREELDQVVKVLRAEGKLIEISRKEQVNRVRQRAREIFPNRFPRPNQPSRSKILQALLAAEKTPVAALGLKSTKSP